MAGSAPLSEHPPVEHPEVRSAIDLLEAWIEAQRVARELPGVSLGIVHDQALVWSGGFGWADVERREPATADTLVVPPRTAPAPLGARTSVTLPVKLGVTLPSESRAWT